MFVEPFNLPIFIYQLITLGLFIAILVYAARAAAKHQPPEEE